MNNNDREIIRYPFIQIDEETINRILTDEVFFREFRKYTTTEFQSGMFRDNKQFDYLYAIHQYLERNSEKRFDPYRTKKIEELYRLHLMVLLVIKDESTFREFCSKKTPSFLGVDRFEIVRMISILNNVDEREFYYSREQFSGRPEDDDYDWNYYINSQQEHNRARFIRKSFKRKLFL